MKHFWAFIGFTVSCVFGFVCLMVWQTVGPLRMIAQFGDGTGKAWQYGESTVFSYRRTVNMLETVTATIHRRIDCEVDGQEQTFDLPQLIREYKVGQRDNLWRTAEYPIKFPVGTKCHMHTYAMWWPLFSIAGRQVELSPIDFAVLQARPK